MDDDQKATLKEFKEAVNMTPKELERWLQTDDSQRAGQKDGGESTGHEMGRNIALLLGKKQADYTDDDVKQMQRVVSYVARHSKQRPEGDVTETNWRYSLMNWGHDPLK